MATKKSKAVRRARTSGTDEVMGRLEPAPEPPFLAQHVAGEEPFTPNRPEEEVVLPPRGPRFQPFPAWAGLQVEVKVIDANGDTHAGFTTNPHQAIEFIKKHTGYSDEAALAWARKYNNLFW